MITLHIEMRLIAIDPSLFPGAVRATYKEEVTGIVKSRGMRVLRDIPAADAVLGDTISLALTEITAGEREAAKLAEVLEVSKRPETR